MRLIGRQRCATCGHEPWACWLVEGDAIGECDACGAMAISPIGPQVLAADICPGPNAEALIADALTARQQRIVRRGSQS